MQAIGAISKSRRAVRFLAESSPIILSSSRNGQIASENAPQLSRFISLGRHFYSALFTEIIRGNPSQMLLNYQKYVMRLPVHSLAVPSLSFSSEAGVIENDSTDPETAKEIYDKMLKSVTERRTAPPNAWLWSLIAKCSTVEDIKLLLDILQRLRIFRLSNLRIPDSFNSALCREVTKACVRIGAIEFGKKALWKHNLYGLAPDMGSAHQMLVHAKQHNDVKLMVEVMNLLKKNDLPLQPGTADIVFSICYSTDRWDLISKYGKRFVKSGVSLRQTSFDLWMEFAARKGDIDSLWKIEKWRSEAMKQHSLSTGFSCAKGFLLDRKPESAAAMIQTVNQTLSDTRRPGITVELQKLVSEWPLEVIKHKKENREAFSTTLQTDISSMINTLPSLGVKANVLMDDFTRKEGILS